MLTRALLVLLLISGAIWPASAMETKVVALGLSDHQVTEAELTGGEAPKVPRFNSPGVAYALIANVKKGDEVRIDLMKDKTSLMKNIEAVDADKATFLIQAGKLGVPAGGWPEGTYTALVKITRDGKVLIEQDSDPKAFE